MTTTPANQTPEEAAATLRRDFILALADSLKRPEVSASGLEVCRKFLADLDTERRWQAEQANRSPDDTPPAPISAPTGIDFARLPFTSPPIGETY